MCREHYTLKYDMEKRISVMISDHGMIDYMFRDFNNALLTYRELGTKLLNSALDSIVKTRTKLINKGATEEQIRIYDSKVIQCFNKSVEIIRNRAENPENPRMEDDLKLLCDINRANIHNYYNEKRWTEHNSKDSNAVATTGNTVGLMLSANRDV